MSEELPQVNSNGRRRKIEFTNKERNAILQYLLQRKINGKLQRGAIMSAAAEFNCNRNTIALIWKRACNSYSTGNRCANVDSLKKNCGRKRKDYTENFARMKDVPLNKRSTLRSLSFAIGIPKTTLFGIFKRGKTIKRVSSAVKPYLTDTNKLERLKFCLSNVLSTGLFIDMYDYIHIDEKWFYLTSVKRSYYLCLDEDMPHRTCKSKRYITKVMFMAAVARPRWDSNNVCTFDGKLGIWPFVYESPAQRNSKNRVKGTIETKCIESITQEETRKMMLTKLYPAIREKWPVESRKLPIIIQQDNAKPHVPPSDAKILREGFRDGWKITLKPQPANSPDFNILDLGFFNSIQSLQHEAAPNTINELIAEVENAFNKESPVTSDYVFLSYQKAMESAMKVNGSNKYKLEHMGKDTLRRNGLLPVSVKCTEELITSCRNHLLENNA